MSYTSEVIMPRCEGMPDGRCPDQRNDSSVKNGEGDLMLCSCCDAERHRMWLESRETNTITDTRSTSTARAGSSSEPAAGKNAVSYTHLTLPTIYSV